MLADGSNRRISKSQSRSHKPRTGKTYRTLDSSKKPPARVAGTLRELCHEDKRRVATLVHNLALALHDRDRAVRHLDQAVVTLQAADERFETLRQRSNCVAQEYEAIRQRYMQSLDLVQQYQRGIEEQQAKHTEELALQRYEHEKIVRQLRQSPHVANQGTQHSTSAVPKEARKRMVSVQIQTAETVWPLLVTAGTSPSAVHIGTQTTSVRDDVSKVTTTDAFSQHAASIASVATQMDHAMCIQSVSTQTQTRTNRDASSQTISELSCMIDAEVQTVLGYTTMQPHEPLRGETHRESVVPEFSPVSSDSLHGSLHARNKRTKALHKLRDNHQNHVNGTADASCHDEDHLLAQKRGPSVLRRDFAPEVRGAGPAAPVCTDSSDDGNEFDSSTQPHFADCFQYRAPRWAQLQRLDWLLRPKKAEPVYPLRIQTNEKKSPPTSAPSPPKLPRSSPVSESARVIEAAERLFIKLQTTELVTSEEPVSKTDRSNVWPDGADWDSGGDWSLDEVEEVISMLSDDAEFSAASVSHPQGSQFATGTSSTGQVSEDAESDQLQYSDGSDKTRPTTDVSDLDDWMIAALQQF
eukprot:SAG31_NODE_2029_length_6629_cov_2.348698_1_plen_582_part_00